MQAALGVGMEGQEMPGPRQRHRRGLVPGDQEGDRFVAQLSIGHRLVRLRIARVDEHTEQVAAISYIAPALGNELPDDPIQAGDGAAAAPVRRRRNRERQGEKVIHQMVGVGQSARYGTPKFVLVLAERGTE